MKRMLCWMLALLLLGLVPAAAVAEDAPVPVEKDATVLVDQAGVAVKTFARGDRVNVKDLRDGCYVVEGESGDLLVEMWLVRLDSEAAAAPFTAYAGGNIDVFPSPYLEGEKLATLYMNTLLTVEDRLGPVMRVTMMDGRVGYTLASGISMSPIQYNGGGSSGGSDGGDIPIGNFGSGGLTVVRLLSTVRQENEQPFAPGSGTILADGAEGYVVLLNRGDMVFVKEKTGSICTVQAGEAVGIMPLRLLAFADDPAYEAWDGFALGNAPLHRHWRMLDEEKKLMMNTKLLVIGEIGKICMVQLEDGYGFVPLDKISRTMIVYNGGDSSGGWTDPVL